MFVKLNITMHNQIGNLWNGSYENLSTPDADSLLVKLNNEAAMLFLPVTIFLAFLMVIGIVGNVIVCLVYCKRKRKSTPDLFILNLAILDLLTCIFGIPMEITDLCLSYTFYAPAACKLLRTLESTTSMASALTLVIISIDRYKRICKYGESFSIKKVKILCVVAICTGFFLSWPLLIIVGKKTVDVGVSGIKGVDCSVSDEMRKSRIPLVYYIVVSLCFVVCLVFVIFVYVRISIFVRRTKANRLRYVGSGDLSNSSTGQQHIQLVVLKSVNMESIQRIDDNIHYPNPVSQENDQTLPRISRVTRKSSSVKVTRTTAIFVVVTIAFIISFLPFLITMVLRNIIKDIEKNMSEPMMVFYKFCLKCFFINNAINPLIYSFLSKRFRGDVKWLFSKYVCISRNAFP